MKTVLILLALNIALVFAQSGYGGSRPVRAARSRRSYGGINLGRAVRRATQRSYGGGVVRQVRRSYNGAAAPRTRSTSAQSAPKTLPVVPRQTTTQGGYGGRARSVPKPSVVNAPPTVPVSPNGEVCNECAPYESMEDIIVQLTGELEGAMKHFMLIQKAPCAGYSAGASNAGPSTTPAATTAAPTTAAAGAASTTAAPSGASSTTTAPSESEFVVPRFIPNMPTSFWYQVCVQNPLNKTACSPHHRKLEQDDYDAMIEAKRLGLQLKYPKRVHTRLGDYEVADPFPKGTSDLRKQLNALLEELNKGKAAAEAAKASVEASANAQNAAAEAARKKAEEDAKAKGLDAAAQKAAADKAAAEAREAERIRQEAASAAAAAEAAARAPKITKSGAFLRSPDGLVLYSMQGESMTDTICVGGCLTAWPRAKLGWAAGAGVGCAVSSTLRSDGERQLTLNGLPAYTFFEDTANGAPKGSSANPAFKPISC